MDARNWTSSILLLLAASLSLHAKVQAVDTAAANVTAKLTTPNSAIVSWTVSSTWQKQNVNNTHLIRWELTYKPLHDRQRITIAIPSEWTSYHLKDLRPDTVYSITVTSVTRNRRTKSSPVHLAVPPMVETALSRHSNIYNSNIYLTPLPNATVAGSIHVRGEEVGIVVLVLAVWVAAISLFFHRWGKIRMLLPYQPVFKEEERAMVPTTPPQIQQQQRSLSAAGCKFPFNSAAVRRHQYMQRGRNGWPTSMSRLSDSLIIDRQHAAVHSASVYQRANTVPGCGGYAYAGHRIGGAASTVDGCSECGSSGANTPRKTLSAEVITLTVTDCGEEVGPSQPITEQDSIQEEIEEPESTSNHHLLRRQNETEVP